MSSHRLHIRARDIPVAAIFAFGFYYISLASTWCIFLRTELPDIVKITDDQIILDRIAISCVKEHFWGYQCPLLQPLPQHQVSIPLQGAAYFWNVMHTAWMPLMVFSGRFFIQVVIEYSKLPSKSHIS